MAQQAAKHDKVSYWRRMVRLSGALLLLWVLVSVLPAWFAGALQGRIAGFPVGYWLVAQGVPLAYLAIIVAYVVRAERLDAAFQAQREAQPTVPPHG